MIYKLCALNILLLIHTASTMEEGPVEEERGPLSPPMHSLQLKAEEDLPHNLVPALSMVRDSLLKMDNYFRSDADQRPTAAKAFHDNLIGKLHDRHSEEELSEIIKHYNQSFQIKTGLEIKYATSQKGLIYLSKSLFEAQLEIERTQGARALDPVRFGSEHAGAVAKRVYLEKTHEYVCSILVLLVLYTDLQKAVLSGGQSQQRLESAAAEPTY